MKIEFYIPQIPPNPRGQIQMAEFFLMKVNHWSDRKPQFKETRIRIVNWLNDNVKQAKICSIKTT